MTDGGWIKLYRRTRQSFVWTDANLLKLWLLLLMKASHEDHRFLFNGQEVAVTSGQLVTGAHTLASEFNEGVPRDKAVTWRTAWRWVKKFETAGMLTIKSTTKYSVISITNWDRYQSADNQVTSARQSTDNQVTTYKNLKNLENEKNKSVGKENPSTTSAFSLWQNVWGFPNAIASQDLQNWVEEFGDELVGWVIQYAARRDVQNRAADKYLDRVFDGYRQRGITNVTQAEAEAAEHEKVAKANAPRSRTYGKPIRQEAKPDWLDKPYQPSDESEDPALHEEITEKLHRLQALREKAEKKGDDVK